MEDGTQKCFYIIKKRHTEEIFHRQEMKEGLFTLFLKQSDRRQSHVELETTTQYVTCNNSENVGRMEEAFD